MIYKQRPDATACAEYDLWNKTMRRYVRRGSKGIALVDNTGSRPKLRYVFDVSDTGERENSRPVNLWSMREEYVPAVQDVLERAYGVGAGAGLEEQIEKISSQLASGYWDDNKEVILGIVDDSFLYGYDEFNVGVSFRRAAETSIKYMLCSRCVEDPESCFEPEDFMDVFDFNTQAASNVLGAAVSEALRDKVIYASSKPAVTWVNLTEDCAPLLSGGFREHASLCGGHHQKPGKAA